MDRVKRLLLLFLPSLLVFVLFVPVLASSHYDEPAFTPVFLDYSSSVGDNYPVAPLASVSSYTVTAFSSGSTTTNLSSGYYTLKSGIVGGVYISIPSNTSAGRLYVYGLLPGFSDSAYSSWTNYAASSTGSQILSPNFIVSSSTLNLLNYNYLEETTPAWPGYVDLPAHTNTLYLYIYAHVPETVSHSRSVGAFYGSNAFITFVPTPDYDSRLSTIASNISTTNSRLSTTNSTLTSVLDHVTSIDNQLASISSSLAEPSPMEQFENDYLDKMGDQLSQVEEMMGPDNPALPNGGDIAGFASDLQNGLGVSGSSFNSQEFSAAVGAFSGTEATAAGGPWEFFTQAVADSLSGETQMSSLSDDDYIYVWLEMMEGRYSSWASSSP